MAAPAALVAMPLQTPLPPAELPRPEESPAGSAGRPPARSASQQLQSETEGEEDVEYFEVVQLGRPQEGAPEKDDDWGPRSRHRSAAPSLVEASAAAAVRWSAESGSSGQQARGSSLAAVEGYPPLMAAAQRPPAAVLGAVNATPESTPRRGPEAQPAALPPTPDVDEH